MPVPSQMSSYVIWSDDEAHERSAKPKGPSSCGVMAVEDILSLLGIEHNADKILLKARQRDYDAGLMGYLESRTTAGTTHADLISSLSQTTSGNVKGCFFSIPSYTTGPELSRHLYHWMEAGAVPLLTMNLFLQGHDAWHHQVVRGVDDKGRIMLLNPIERLEPHTLIPLLSSPPFMIIPREHIYSKLLETIKGQEEGHVSSAINTILLMCEELDSKAPWNQFRVGSQISGALDSMIQEHHSVGKKFPPFSDLIIPFGGLAGVTLFYHIGSKAEAMVQKLPSPLSLDLPAYDMKVEVHQNLVPPLNHSV